ncbi:hypothetical protein BDW59DRAFT_145264 [Aspergillus cavernicola]|uniref:Uncharacterized protein n=1 Tax=Aspergillus cavernicola TaxID=176166 RepID=A0ABR4IFF6_9EURO
MFLPFNKASLTAYGVLLRRMLILIPIYNMYGVGKCDSSQRNRLRNVYGEESARGTSKRLRSPGSVESGCDGFFLGSRFYLGDCCVSDSRSIQGLSLSLERP